MKTLLIVICLSLVLFIIVMFVWAQQSKTPPKLGLVNTKLAPCQQTTNCVNSMDASGLDAITFATSSEQAWLSLAEVVAAMNGKIERQEGMYLWATFRTPLFGFVDDVEFLLEPATQRIQIRSASRVGRSDFSANRNRVEALREAFKTRESLN